ncbi:MAG: outer membrane beta-barrel protein [Spirochaetaceae bacterium]|nr:outer membrane beta-barrel protein [Spirochaetaceae bacterium]
MRATCGLRVAAGALLLLAPLANLAAQEVMEGSGIYVSAAYGIALPADRTIGEETLKTEVGLLGGQAGVGLHLFGFRPELSAGYRLASVKDREEQSITAIDVIASVYYDLGIGILVSPYVGIGGGVSQSTVKREKSKSVLTPAFQGAAGIGFVLGDLTLTLGYRLRGTTDAEIPDTKELLKAGLTHSVEAGLRYSF